jgi:hypothetical protein
MILAEGKPFTFAQAQAFLEAGIALRKHTATPRFCLIIVARVHSPHAGRPGPTVLPHSRKLLQWPSFQAQGSPRI